MNISSEFKETLKKAQDLLEVLGASHHNMDAVYEVVGDVPGVTERNIRRICSNQTTTPREKVVALLLEAEMVNVNDIVYNAIFDRSKLIPDLEDCADLQRALNQPADKKVPYYHPPILFTYTVESDRIDDLQVETDGTTRWVTLDGRRFALVTESYFFNNQHEVDDAADIWTTYDNLGILEKDCDREERKMLNLQRRLKQLGVITK